MFPTWKGLLLSNSIFVGVNVSDLTVGATVLLLRNRHLAVHDPRMRKNPGACRRPHSHLPIQKNHVWARPLLIKSHQWGACPLWLRLAESLPLRGEGSRPCRPGGRGVANIPLPPPLACLRRRGTLRLAGASIPSTGLLVAILRRGSTKTNTNTNISRS